MRVFIAGLDGYLGWPLSQYLTGRGHDVAGVDNFSRRRWVEEMGSWSAVPVAAMPHRLDAFDARFGVRPQFWQGDLCDYGFVEQVLREFQPDSIVHLGECPSAAYSMIDVHHAVAVQTGNITSTFNLLFAMRDVCRDAHLVKLGTMGEYGTPNVDIPEGFFEMEFRGRSDRAPFPRQAGSWYHWSKVHGSNNTMFATSLWGLRTTDVMQGVVFGIRAEEAIEDERLLTGLDFDQAFGTVVNRFCCQAVIGHPLTPYGKGKQKRGFIPIRDAMQCLALAVENPPGKGEYRVFNQFQQICDINEVASKVRRAARSIGLEVEVRGIENPRRESEKRYYNPDHQHLHELGYRPTGDMDSELKIMMEDLIRHRQRIEQKREVLIPDVWWDGAKGGAPFLR